MAFLGLGRQAKAGHPYDSQVTSRRERVDGIDSAGHGKKPLGNSLQRIRKDSRRSWRAVGFALPTCPWGPAALAGSARRGLSPGQPLAQAPPGCYPVDTVVLPGPARRTAADRWRVFATTVGLLET